MMSFCWSHRPPALNRMLSFAKLPQSADHKLQGGGVALPRGPSITLPKRVGKNNQHMNEHTHAYHLHVVQPNNPLRHNPGKEGRQHTHTCTHTVQSTNQSTPEQPGEGMSATQTHTCICACTSSHLYVGCSNQVLWTLSPPHLTAFWI